LAEVIGLIPHQVKKAGIKLAHIHVYAQFRNVIEIRDGISQKISGERCDREEVLGIGSGHEKRGRAAVGVTRSMKFVVLNLIVVQHQDDELGEDFTER
jgi:hypothetical protein